MKLKAAAQWMLAILLMAPCMQAQSVWNTTHLANVKRSIREPFYATAYETLKKEADRLSDAQPLSVMMKEKTPASGDKHDYMSQARYFWPDPAKPDGLPYINRDGISNPELNKLDRNRLGTTANRITTLALAWYFSEEEKYARKATELIRVWFLDKATRMNPNLEYAQMIPGHNNDKGRCYGLIDTYSFIEMLDAVALLEQSKAFTAKDSKQLKKWFAELTDWMLTSPQGKEEAAGANNHSVAYDAQIIAFALYTGNKKLAQEVVDTFAEKRIFPQIAPDGRQPYELQRTLAFHYSQYNLTHFIDIMLMARTLGTSLEEMSVKGLDWKENVVISSMCTVFAESEVVSLVAQNKEVSDIIHGLNVSVASKVGALAARLGKNNPGEYMMTGGVAKNQGIIQALEDAGYKPKQIRPNL